MKVEKMELAPPEILNQEPGRACVFLLYDGSWHQEIIIQHAVFEFERSTLDINKVTFTFDQRVKLDEVNVAEAAMRDRYKKVQQIFWRMNSWVIQLRVSYWRTDFKYLHKTDENLVLRADCYFEFLEREFVERE